MAASRAMALLLLVALTLACFISAPVLSGEHPWDADGSGTEGVTEDTLIVVTEVDTAGGTSSVGSGDSGSGDMFDLLSAWLNGIAQLM